MAELFAYKILTREQWDTLRADGVFEGAPVDLADGYLHLSTQAQPAETVTKHFAGQDDLILAMVDLAAVGDKVKWEVSRGGQHFPQARKSTRLNSRHYCASRMPSSACKQKPQTY